MATYVNDLRLKEIATGDESGTWGTKTNTNLELIADAFGSGTEAITTNADTHTTTIADGAADEGRALFLKYTGTLASACTITIAPNTVNKLWFIENATSGSQNIIISQGSGANITIANGKVAAVYTDGAGSGAAVLDVFADLEISSTLTVAGNVTMSADATVGDDLTLLSDAAVLGFGADTDVTLTHVADTGLLLNSTMAIQFNDASQYINAPSNAILDINATDEIELNATLADVNANLDVSGTIVGASTIEGTTITATTAFVPDASDGAALGTASLEFSDLFLADEAVISFGDDDDVTLTHVADTGLLLNSTMALQFNDASQYINAPSATVLDINATDEIELNATAVDLNGTLDVSGATTLGADLSVPATSKIYLDGGGNTYIHESSGDTMRFFCGGTSRFQIQADGVMIPSGAYLYLDNGGNTYITEGSADVMRFFAGGSKQFECSGTNLSVVGALSKGSGSFRIDHPLDSMKDTHDLVHSFIEGPRADLMYRGSVQLSGGTATVDLDAAATMTDGTWELLCRDPQVWVQNQDGWTQVRGSVSGSTLTITAQAGDCTDTVSWLVVAERQDEHMMDTNWTDNNGRVIVEPEKPAEDEEEAEDDGE